MPQRRPSSFSCKHSSSQTHSGGFLVSSKNPKHASESSDSEDRLWRHISTSPPISLLLSANRTSTISESTSSRFVLCVIKVTSGSWIIISAPDGAVEGTCTKSLSLHSILIFFFHKALASHIGIESNVTLLLIDFVGVSSVEVCIVLLGGFVGTGGCSKRSNALTDLVLLVLNEIELVTLDDVELEDEIERLIDILRDELLLTSSEVVEDLDFVPLWVIEVLSDFEIDGEADTLLDCVSELVIEVVWDGDADDVAVFVLLDDLVAVPVLDGVTDCDGDSKLDGDFDLEVVGVIVSDFEIVTVAVLVNDLDLVALFEGVTVDVELLDLVEVADGVMLIDGEIDIDEVWVPVNEIDGVGDLSAEVETDPVLEGVRDIVVLEVLDLVRDGVIEIDGDIEIEGVLDDDGEFEIEELNEVELVLLRDLVLEEDGELETDEDGDLDCVIDELLDGVLDGVLDGDSVIVFELEADVFSDLVGLAELVIDDVLLDVSEIEAVRELDEELELLIETDGVLLDDGELVIDEDVLGELDILEVGDEEILAVLLDEAELLEDGVFVGVLLGLGELLIEGESDMDGDGVLLGEGEGELVLEGLGDARLKINSILAIPEAPAESKIVYGSIKVWFTVESVVSMQIFGGDSYNGSLIEIVNSVSNGLGSSSFNNTSIQHVHGPGKHSCSQISSTGTGGSLTWIESDIVAGGCIAWYVTTRSCSGVGGGRIWYNVPSTKSNSSYPLSNVTKFPGSSTSELIRK